MSTKTKTKSRPDPAPPPPAVRAPAPPAASPAAPVRARPGVLPVVALVPSPTNPRRTFPDESLTGLADSIRAVGVRQRLLVRPVAEEGHPAPRYDDAAGQWVGVAHFEVVAGERRLRAAKLAGLDAVPVDVCDLADDQVLLVQLVENDQREDVRPSEQAAAYRRLADAGRTAEQIAADTGKSVSFVRGLLRLGRLPAWALAAVDAGTLPRATAELVARVPGDDARQRAAACVRLGLVDPRDLGDGWEKPGRWSSETPTDDPLSYRETRDLIRNHFTVELKQAPFDRRSLDLVAEAGSCEACTKRAGNDPEAVADGVRADVCLDPDCYRAKVAAHRAAEIAKARSKGVGEADVEITDLRRQPRGWLFAESQLRHCAPELDVAGVRPKDAERKLKDLLAAPVKVPQYLAFGPGGKPVRLLKTAEARRALQELGVIPKPEPRKKAPSTDTGSKETGAAAEKPKSGPGPIEVENRTALVAAERCRTMLLANAESLAEMSAAGGPDTDAVYQALSLAARVLVRDWLIYGDDRKDAVERLVPATAAVEIREKKCAAADRAVAGMTPAEIVGLILGLTTHVAAADGSRTTFDPIYRELIDYADTTLADCEQQARSELTGGEPADAKIDRAEAAAPAPTPVGTPLAAIPGVPAAAAAHLAAVGVRTLEDLDAKLAALRQKKAYAKATRYTVLKELNCPEVYPTGDAIVDWESDRAKPAAPAPKTAPKSTKTKGARP